jgi:hypothetical protein
VVLLKQQQQLYRVSLGAMYLFDDHQPCSRDSSRISDFLEGRQHHCCEFTYMDLLNEANFCFRQRTIQLLESGRGP